MRPRKRVLMFCPDEWRMRELRYMLELRGFKVTTSATVEQFERELGEALRNRNFWDATMVVLTRVTDRESVLRAEAAMAEQAYFPGTVVLVTESLRDGIGHRANCCKIFAPETAVSALTQAVKRVRGPKVEGRYPPRSVAVATAGGSAAHAG